MATSEPAVNITINIDKNGTTTLATAGCICKRDIDINVNVPSTGVECDGRHIPDDALLISGDISDTFKNNQWIWFIRDYGNEITTENITALSYPFYQSDELESIPFDLNCDNTTTISASGTFSGCKELKSIGTIRNAVFYYFQNIFTDCYKLRYLPNFENCDFSDVGRAQTPFKNCYSLRSISENFLKDFFCDASTSTYHLFGNLCTDCYALDEIRNINPHPTKTFTSDMFASAFSNCSRLKELTFAVQEDGTPYVCNWKNQTINLTNYLGWASYNTKVLNYNSGITADKQVKDDVTYQALKDDPDWFTCNASYSRFNHDSAVNLINSLPDTSAYLATQSGATNTIKFKGIAGELTDGGAINTLTEDEIAVATAKGWTVQIV